MIWNTHIMNNAYKHTSETHVTYASVFCVFGTLCCSLSLSLSHSQSVSDSWMDLSWLMHDPCVYVCGFGKTSCVLSWPCESNWVVMHEKKLSDKTLPSFLCVLTIPCPSHISLYLCKLGLCLHTNLRIPQVKQAMVPATWSKSTQKAQLKSRNQHTNVIQHIFSSCI